MAKRSDDKFVRNSRDFYPTPEETVVKLLPYVKDVSRFSEPMCGDGAIVKALEKHGKHCVSAWDLEPQGDMKARAHRYEVTWLEEEDFEEAQAIISNPPWPMPAKRRKEITEGLPNGWPTVHIIQHLMSFLPSWMLLSADFMHAKYFRNLEAHCSSIVSVGRVKWITGSPYTSKDNASWYKFDINHTDGPTFTSGR